MALSFTVTWQTYSLANYQRNWGKWSHLRQLKKKTLIFFLLSITRENKLSLLYLISKSIILRLLKNCWSFTKRPKQLLFVLYNNIFYTRLAFVFDLHKDFYCVHDNIDSFFLFLFQKNFDIFRGSFLPFVFFLLQKGFDSFHSFFLKPLFIFIITFSWNFYIYEKMFDRFLIHFKIYL